MNVAVAPADVPEITIWLPLKSLKCLSKYSKCAYVLFYPLKYNFLFLYSIGFDLKPICTLPSQ